MLGDDYNSRYGLEYSRSGASWLSLLLLPLFFVFG